MSQITRIKTVVLLGALSLVLLFHNFYWFRLLSVWKNESIKYIVMRFGHYMVPVSVGVTAFLLLAGLILYLLLKRKQSFNSTSRYGTRILLSVFVLFIMFMYMLLILNYRGVPPLEWSGPVSLLALISLIFFLIFSKRKMLILSHIILIILAGVIPIIPSFFSSHRDKVAYLKKSIEQEKQALMNKREILKSFNPALFKNKFLQQKAGITAYRFDDYLDEINEMQAPSFNHGEGVLLDIPNAGTLSQVEDSSALTIKRNDNALILSGYKGGTLLQNKEKTDLEISEIGSFTIRMKVSAGHSFRIYWNDSDIFNPSAGIQIPLGSPGEYHNYEIREAILSISSKVGIRRISRIFLMPSDQNAKIEIEFVRILERMATLCRESPIEVGYESVGGEIRKVLYARSPSEIIYSVNIPLESPLLLFGISTADPHVSVFFQVALRRGESETLLFSEEAFDAKRWQDKKIELTAWAGQSVQIIFRTISENPNIGFWSNPILLGTPQKRPNVLIFLVDALRADHLGIYGYKQDTSPLLDQFSARGVLFEHTYSNGCTTKHSVPSLFTSMPITALGVWDSMSLVPESYVTLSEILRKAGYNTAAFSANANVGPFSGIHRGFSQLFEKQYFQQEDETQDLSPSKLGAKELIGDTLMDWLEDNANRNFFLYIHTIDVHGPYDPPMEYRTFLEENGRPVSRMRRLDPPWLLQPTIEARISLYDDEIRYSDAYFARLIDKLKELGIFENTIIILTADHGEYFGEHGLWGHNPPPYVQGTHVPLFLVYPGKIPAGLRITQNVQILDLMPTILDIIGLNIDFSLFQGDSLLSLIMKENDRLFEERAIYVESGRPGQASIHLSRFHFIPEKNHLFDLSSDPREKSFLNEFIFDFRLKYRLRNLARLYMNTYAILNDRMAEQIEKTFHIDQETLEQLRALGYIN